jgi:hypothetical protein
VFLQVLPHRRQRLPRGLNGLGRASSGCAVDVCDDLIQSPQAGLQFGREGAGTPDAAIFAVHGTGFMAALAGTPRMWQALHRVVIGL